jgi:hypothetical protein
MDEGSTEQGRADASATAELAKERAGAVAGTATDQAMQVVDSAKEQAGQLRDQVSVQGREVIQTATSAIKEQGRAQTEQVATTVRHWADQSRALADGRPDEAGQLADYMGQAANRATEVAERLEQRGFDGVIVDVQSFARRRPGAFLLGAAVAGFGVGRLLRSGAASGTESRATSGNGHGIASMPANPAMSPPSAGPEFGGR